MARLEVRRCDSGHLDFLGLVEKLDAFLAELNGEQHGFYSSHNRTATLANCVVAYLDEQPAGCGAFRAMQDGAAEVKRMFVLPAVRGAGVGRVVLAELERFAQECGYSTARLETSKRLLPAVGLYQSAGYRVIPKYGPYVGVDDSVCMEKTL